MSVSYGGDKITFDDGTSIASGLSHFRNRIINGDMRIDQRNAGASGTANDNYTVDRWEYFGSQASKGTWQQSTTVVPPGFTHSLSFTSSSAYTVGASESFQFTQHIEGYNAADLMWGTANAKTITLSFWVRSSLTGTFGGVINMPGNTRAYPFTYTISSGNTWEYKTVTIPGDTSGTWPTDNGRGISLRFSLGVGSTYSAAANAWTGTSNIFGATGATSVVGTNNATWYITGVQLEQGSYATSFERRPYGTELALCQRYYYLHASGNSKGVCTAGAFTSSNLNGVISFPVSMRTAPTSASVSGTDYYVFYRNNGGDTFNSLSLEGATNMTAALFNSTEISSTAGHAGSIYTNNASAFIAFRAEL